MQYLCERQLTAGGKTYNPGDIIPDGVILLERSSKLIKNGYISKIDGGTVVKYSGNQNGMFTQEQVDSMVAGAVAVAVAELKKTELNAWQDIIQISVKRDSDGENEQITVIPARPEEMQQVFSIMQLNAEEGAKAIAGVKSENVLILLHAADSRKTIKNAAKEQADKLFSNESNKGNETTDTNMEGADT